MDGACGNFGPNQFAGNHEASRRLSFGKIRLAWRDEFPPTTSGSRCDVTLKRLEGGVVRIFRPA
eukprot:scaffold1803_cov92-Amphora_coffeaeformis.AAC.25